MAEFPDLGKNCSWHDCHQLDFLPLTCDSCKMGFCTNHIRYESHECAAVNNKDKNVQLQVCPLCNKNVSFKFGTEPEEAIREHISQGCYSFKQADKSNRCTFEQCRNCELVSMFCNECHHNFCLEHRFQATHNCQGFESTAQDIDLDEQLRNPTDFRNQCVRMMANYFGDYGKNTISVPPLTAKERDVSAQDMRFALASKNLGGILLSGLPLRHHTVANDVTLPLPASIRFQFLHLQRLMDLAADQSAQYMIYLHPKIGFRIFLCQSMTTKIQQVNMDSFRIRVRNSVGNQNHRAAPNNQEILNRMIILTAKYLCSPSFASKLNEAVEKSIETCHATYENIPTFCEYIKQEIDKSAFDFSVDETFRVFVASLIGISTLRGVDDKNRVTFLTPQEMDHLIFTPIKYQIEYKEMLAVKRRRSQSMDHYKMLLKEHQRFESETILGRTHSQENFQIEINNCTASENLCAEECVAEAEKFYGPQWLPNLGQETIILRCLTAEEDANGTVAQFIDGILNAKIGGLLFSALPHMRNCIDMKAKSRLFPEDARLALYLLQSLVYSATLRSRSLVDQALSDNYFIFFHPTLGVRIFYGRRLRGDIKIQMALSVALHSLCRSLNNLQIKQTHIHARSAQLLCEELIDEVRTSASSCEQKKTCQNIASIFLGLLTFTGRLPGVNNRLFLTQDQWLTLQSKSELKIIHGLPQTGKSTLLKIELLEQCDYEDNSDKLHDPNQELHIGRNIDQNITAQSQIFQAQFKRKYQRQPLLCILEKHAEDYGSFLEAANLKQRVEVIFFTTMTNLADIVGAAGERSLFIDAVTELTFELKEAIRARDYKTVVFLEYDLHPGLDQPKLYYLEWFRLSTQPQNTSKREPLPSSPVPEILHVAIATDLVEQQQGETKKKGKPDVVPDFIEQALQTMDQFYPQWKEVLMLTDAETILIPTCLDVTDGLYSGPLHVDIPGYKEKGVIKRKGQTAEEYFLNAFRQMKIGGILIGGFDTQFFIKEMTKKKVSGFNDKKLLNQWKLNKKHIECDFVFIHQKLGIYTIEIKAITEDRNSSCDTFFNKACSQTERQRNSLSEIFKKLTRESLTMPIGAAISFPFVNMNDIKKLPEIDFIDSTTLSTKDSFRQFWESKFSSNIEEFCSVGSYYLFITAIIGYRSLAYISEAYNAIQVHQLLNLRQDNYFAELEHSDTSKAETFEKNKSDKEKAENSFATGEKLDQPLNMPSAICLTNVQIEALECSKKCQLISGPPGTGKTLIVQQKALQCAKTAKSGRVIVCLYNPALVPKYEQFFADHKDELIRVPIVIVGLPDFPADEDDWFGDEMPMQANTSTLRIYRDRMTKSGTTVLAVTGWMQLANLRSVKTLVATELTEYSHFELTIALRGSMNIIKDWQSDLPEEVKVRIGHSISGENVDRIAVNTVDEVLNMLYDKLLPYFNSARVNVSSTHLLPPAGKLSPCHLAVLTEYNISTELVKSYLTCRGIPCGSPFEQSRNANLVAIGPYLESMSFEWPIVFIASVVCLDYFESLHLIGASRSMAKLIIIERNHMPVQRTIDLLIESYADIAQISYVEFESIVSLGREMLEEKELDSFNFDKRFAAVRQNYFPPSLRRVPQFRSCTNMTECFATLSESKFLCRLLLETEKVRQSVEILASGFYSIGQQPPRIIRSLWAELPENEAINRWCSFQSLANSLRTEYNLRLRSAKTDEPSLLENITRISLQKSKDWDFVWEILQVFLLTSVYSLGD